MSDFVFPKPRDPETLEDMASDIFSYELGNSNLQRYARNGQSQNGVDVAGLVGGEVVGIQCKNHVNKDITVSEIDKEIKKSEKFRPSLSRYIIVTSAERERKAHSHVLKVSRDRVKNGKYPVDIFFWKEIEDLLLKYPDLAVKYYTSRLPVQKPDEVTLPDPSVAGRKTFVYPAEKSQITKGLEQELSVRKVDKYNASIGISTFPEVGFDGCVDIDLPLAHLFSGEGMPHDSFAGTIDSLRDLKRFLGNKFFSKELTLFIQTRLIVAFLLGQAFRKVTKYNLTLVSGNQVWRTYDLPIVPSDVFDTLPEINSGGLQEAVVVLNIARDISSSVRKFTDSWKEKPGVTITYSVGGRKISSAAHALAVSIDIAKRLKNLKDGWGIKRIHFFGAIPAPLATLIAYHLNSMCPMNIYFMDQSSGEYVLGGEITNDLI